MNERIPRLERGNWIYYIICFLLFRAKKKLTYKEYMMILYGVNKKKLGEQEAKEKAIIRTIEVYKYLHEGSTPKIIEI